MHSTVHKKRRCAQPIFTHISAHLLLCCGSLLSRAMAHVCARSSLCLRSNTFRASPARQGTLRARCIHTTVRAASTGQSADLFFVAQNNFKVHLTDQSCCTPTESPEMVCRTTARKLPGLIQVTKEGCEQFEEIWKNRESHLKETPGFIRFALLRGDEEGKKTLACSKWSHVLPGNTSCLSCRRIHQ